MSFVPPVRINDEKLDRSNILLPDYLAVIIETTGLPAEKFEVKDM